MYYYLLITISVQFTRCQIVKKSSDKKRHQVATNRVHNVIRETKTTQ